MKKEKPSKIDWNTIKPGTWFSAVIRDIPVIGKVQIEAGDIYLCQNYLLGCHCIDKLKFKCSWVLGNKNTANEYLAKENPSVRKLVFHDKKPKISEKVFSITSYIACAIKKKHVVFNYSRIEIKNSFIKKAYKQLEDSKNKDLILTQIEKALHNGYTAQIDSLKKTLKIGCQKIPYAKIGKLVSLLED